jgi:hypothetical protein
MISLTTLAVLGWVPLILVLFNLLRPRRAVIVAYVCGWMFLPIVRWDFPGLPGFDKTTATNLGIFVAVLLFDTKSLLRFRPALVDLPVLVMCLCPIGSSVTNGLGLYDGLSGTWVQIVVWAIPWVIGRCYLGSLPALHDLALCIFVGAIVYVPLCIFEMLFGAILHLKVYGYYQHDPLQTIRADGSVRPMVFMQHGLMLAMWMAAGALAGLAVAREAPRGSSARLWRTAIAGGLVVMSFLIRSVGASVLMLIGLAVWYLARATRSWLPIGLLVLAVPTYMTVRASGAVGVADLTSMLSSGMETAGFSHAEASARLQSALVRFDAEDRLFERVRQDPLFGVGGWYFNEYRDPVSGEIRTFITDGYWTIQLTTRGLVGLAAWVLIMLLPVLHFARTFPVGTWGKPLVSVAAVMSVVLLLNTLDCLLNSNINPVFTLIAAGLAGLPRPRRVKEPARGTAETGARAHAVRSAKAAAANEERGRADHPGGARGAAG